MTVETDETDETVEIAPTCAYPGCTHASEPQAPGAQGTAPRYCGHPEHDALGAFRTFRAERQQHKEDRRAAAEAKKGEQAPVAEQAWPAIAEAAEQVPAEAVSSGTAAGAAVAEAGTGDHAAAARSRDDLVGLIERLAADLPSSIEELAIIANSASAEAPDRDGHPGLRVADPGRRGACRARCRGAEVRRGDRRDPGGNDPSGGGRRVRTGRAGALPRARRRAGGPARRRPRRGR